MAMTMLVSEAASVLRVTPHRVRQLIDDGRLRCDKRNSRIWFLDEAEVRAFAKRVRPTGRPRKKLQKI